mgnify:CR=1 FL=1
MHAGNTDINRPAVVRALEAGTQAYTAEQGVKILLLNADLILSRGIVTENAAVRQFDLRLNEHSLSEVEAPAELRRE